MTGLPAAGLAAAAGAEVAATAGAAWVGLAAAAGAVVAAGAAGLAASVGLAASAGFEGAGAGADWQAVPATTSAIKCRYERRLMRLTTNLPAGDRRAVWMLARLILR